MEHLGGRSFSIRDPSDVGNARRETAALATRLGFDEMKTGKIAIAITEAGTNLLNHAGGGEIVVRAEHAGIEILALDKGPGMTNVARCLQDGYSTGGTAGSGLGSLSRLADLFDIHSMPGLGTAILTQFWLSLESREKRGALTVGAVCVPYPGETECGDAWALVDNPDRSLLLVVDGLGHGPGAAEASREAVNCFRSHAGADPSQLMERLDGALKKTRGAAAAIASFDFERREIQYSGIGNISGSILANGHKRGMASMNGIVGHDASALHAYRYPWEQEQIVVLHSDGLASRWALDEPHYLGLLSRHPALIAGVLYRDYRRGRDDETVVVVKR